MKWPAGPPKIGGVADVAMDRDGNTVWIFERCGNVDDGCAINRTLDPIMHFDADGNLLKTFGAGMFVDPHGIFVDKSDNIWVVDSITKATWWATRCANFARRKKPANHRHRRHQGQRALPVQRAADVLVAPTAPSSWPTAMTPAAMTGW